MNNKMRPLVQEGLGVTMDAKKFRKKLTASEDLNIIYLRHILHIQLITF